MAFESYRKITGVIRAIVTGDSCCSQVISIMTDNGIVNFNVSMNTIIVDNIRLRRGMRVAAYYDANLPVPAIFPPQYQAQLITALRQNQEVMLNFFDEDMLAEDDSLQLNIGSQAGYIPGKGTCPVFLQQKKYDLQQLQETEEV